MPAFLTDRKWLAVLLAVFMAVALSACGGGGGGGTAPMPDPEPMPPTAEEMCTDAGNHWVDGACLTPGEYTVQMTLASIAAAATAADAQAAYDAVKDQVTATQGEALQAAVNARIEAINMAARVEAQTMALMGAAANIDTSDLSTAEAIAAANNAIAGLEAALNAAVDLTDAQKATYQTQLDDAKDAVATAQTGLDTQGRMMAQRMAISNAVTMARTAVNGVHNESTDTEVSNADSAIAALKAAIDGAADLTAGDPVVASAQGSLATLEVQLATAKAARQTAMDAADEEMRKEMAAKGKALKKALGSMPLANLGSDADTARATITATGQLQVGLPDPADTATPPTTFVSSPSMRAGASAGSLGGWAGTNYAHTNAGTKVTNSAIVYTNQGPPTVRPFATGARQADGTTALDVITTGTPTTVGQYRASTRTLRVSVAGTPSASTAEIAGAMFPTAGTTIYTPTSPSSENILDGTYQGAQGKYRCTGTCSATAGSGGAVSLDGNWDFVHASGATTSRPDADYLFFGWWLQEDKDGPTSASAFTGIASTDGTPIAPYAAAADFPSSGTATYVGGAAGKFAISSPLGGSDAGHFTADATLTARFSGSASGVSGTLDNFMANEQAVPWSVSLNRAQWGTTDGTDIGAFASEAAVADAADRTIWSIDGNSAAESGGWSGRAYDEKPGTTAGGDGSNVPTTLIGTFHSEFGSTHTMVGAFGATKQ